MLNRCLDLYIITPFKAVFRDLKNKGCKYREKWIKADTRQIFAYKHDFLLNGEVTPYIAC